MVINPPETMALSIKEFCQSIGISKASFYKLARHGDAPPLTRIGQNRLVILKASAEAWLKSKEAA